MAYNDSYHKFFAEMFREIKSFEPTRNFYEDKRTNQIRSLKNSLLGEPHSRAAQYVSLAIINKPASAEQLIEACETLTFDRFLEMKANFL